MTYTLAIPIFNEEKNIKNLVNAINNSFLINDSTCIKILLVNDGSVDRSKSLIKLNIKKNHKILLLSHKKNMGYGAALKTAIKYSKNKSDYIIFTDSDLTNPIEDIRKISIFMKQDVDYIQANRYKNNKDNMEVHRKFIGIIGNFLCRFFMNMKIYDYTNGFRAVKTSLYNNIELKENNFSIIMEEKYKLKKYISTIAEFGTFLGRRGENLSKTSFEYSFKLLIKYLFYCVMTIFKINKNLKKVD